MIYYMANLRSKHFIGGKQRIVYTGPKGGKYYMKGGQKHYMKGGLNVGNQCEETSLLSSSQCCHKRTSKVRNGEQLMSYRWCKDEDNSDYQGYKLLKRDFNRIKLGNQPYFLKTKPILNMFLKLAIKHERKNANIINKIQEVINDK